MERTESVNSKWEWKPICRGCINNTGGSCCYDMELEAKEDDVPLYEIFNDKFCAFFEYPEDY